MFRDTVRNLLESSNENKDLLLESVAATKTSKKIQKLISKLKSKTSGESELKDIIEKLEEVKRSFETLEKKYDSSNKEAARAEYKVLNNKYSELLSLLQKENIFSAFKKIGGLSLIAAAITLGYFGVVTNEVIVTNAILGKDSDFLNQGYQGSKDLVKKIINKEKVINYADTMTKMAKASTEEMKKNSFFDAYGRKDALSAVYKQSMEANALLNAAGTINGAIYGTAAVSSLGIVALFKKLGNIITRKNSMFYKTRTILDRIKNMETKKDE